MPSIDIDSFFKQLLGATSDVINVLAVGDKPVMQYIGYQDPEEAEIENIISSSFGFEGKYSGDFDGRCFIFLPVKLALFVAGSLMGGVVSKGLQAVEKSALFELFNNIMGRSISVWNQVIPGGVRIADQKLVDPEVNKPSIDVKNWVMIKSRCSMGGEDFDVNLFLTRGDIDRIWKDSEPKKEPQKEVKMAEEKRMNDFKHEPEPPASQPPSRNIGKEQGMRSEPESQPIMAQKATFQQLETAQRIIPGDRPIDLILDVPLLVSVELGRKDLTVRDILELAPGSIVELDQLAGEPVDLLVNGKLFARGEVVVIDENFGIRVTNIISPQERVEKIR